MGSTPTARFHLTSKASHDPSTITPANHLKRNHFPSRITFGPASNTRISPRQITSRLDVHNSTALAVRPAFTNSAATTDDRSTTNFWQYFWLDVLLQALANLFGWLRDRLTLATTDATTSTTLPGPIFTLRASARFPEGAKRRPKAELFRNRITTGSPSYPPAAHTMSLEAPAPQTSPKSWHTSTSSIRYSVALRMHLEDGGSDPRTSQRGHPQRVAAFSTPSSATTRRDLETLGDDVKGLGRALEEDLRLEGVFARLGLREPEPSSSSPSEEEEDEEHQGRPRTERRRKKRAPRKQPTHPPLFPPLTAAQTSALDHALALTSPTAHIDAKHRLTRRDLAMLLPPTHASMRDGWLNDELVNEYIALVMETHHRQQGYAKKRGMIPRVYAFNSQFTTSYRQRGYAGVARWAARGEIPGRNLLAVDEILIPICDAAHWTLLTISPPRRKIRYFNSLGRLNCDDVAMARDWLAGQLGAAYVPGEWTAEDGGSAQQGNGADCGVFCAMNAHAVMSGREPGQVFGPAQASGARRWMGAALIMGSLGDEGG